MEIIIKFFVMKKNAVFKLVIMEDTQIYLKMVSKGTCLNHKINCPNSILNVDHTKDPKLISKRIMPLFEDHCPSLKEVESSIKCFNDQSFSNSF